MKPENVELEIGDMTNSCTSANYSSDKIMDRVKMEFLIGDADIPGSLTEEAAYRVDEEGADLRKGSDIPEGIIERKSLAEQTITMAEEEGGRLRLTGNALGEPVANTSLPGNATDPVVADFRANCDHILECMTVTSSPAEQTTDLLEEVSGDLRRNGIFPPEENDSQVVHEQRNLTTIIIGANHNFGVNSRYLSARSASCHDLCKRGHKRHLQDPKRRSLGTLIGVRPLMRTTGDAILVSNVETKKKALLRRSSLPGFIVENGPQTHSENMNHFKKDLNRLKMKRIQSETKPPCAPSSGHSSSRSKTDIQASKKTVIQSPKLLENSSQTVKEIKTRKEIGSHSRATDEKAKVPMNNPVSPKTPLTQKKSPSVKTRVYKNLQTMSHVKTQNNSKENKVNGSVDVPEETLYMIEPSTDKKPAKRALKVSSSSKKVQNTEKAKKPMSNPSSPRTPVALKRSSSVKARIYKNLKSSKNHNHPEEAKITRSVDVPEKTLYMIESSSDKKTLRRASTSASSNKSLANTPRASCVSAAKDSEAMQKGNDHLSPSSTSASILTVPTEQEPFQPQVENQEDSDSTNTKQICMTTPDGRSGPSTPRTISTANSNAESEKTGTSDSEKDGSSWMVKFRRGTMVALQVAETSPKRLQFRRAISLGDDQSAKDEAVCLKKTEMTVNKPRNTKPETGEVRLRHQEEAGKKGSLDLNNVIEETASKLVKTQKSKVKALVGAFETVISLHDRKPLVETRVSFCLC